jgi:bifunctional non-homologous end joining protein LigD
MVDALKALPCQAAVIDAELVLQAEDGAPDFYGLPEAISTRPHELTVFAFDLLHRDGVDLRPLALSRRKDQLTTLVRRSKVNCLQLIASFPDGAQLLATAERMRLEGIVSKRRTAPYSSGECRDWRKVKTVAWLEANRERWRMFERGTLQ